MDSPVTSPPGPVFLIGLPGAGKSSAGPRLARLLGRPFLDLDDEIAARAGRSVAQLFAERGEEGFRACEAEALARAAPGHAVIAVGGGAPAWGDNLRVMQAAGTVVWLRAAPAEIVRRLGAAGVAGRPLLRHAVDAEAAVAGLLVRRAAAYQQADVIIDTAGLGVDEVAARAAQLLALPVIAVDVPPRPAGRYAVRVDPLPGAEERLAAALLRAMPEAGAGLGVVTDENVARLHLPRVEAALRARGLALVPCVVPPGEGSKSLAQAERLCCALLEGGLDRQGALLALGGGVVSDLCGFVAATLLRGLPWAVAPTTLLAQADAAIGGKTAVNLPLGKNLVGAFHAPRLVYADLGTLATLPERERVAGLGEVLKHALLAGEDMLALLERAGGAEAARAGDAALLAELVGRCCRDKARVVAADPEERDPGAGRVLLNLGHTVGHALETASLETAAPLLHGEAVALGLLASARVGAALCHTPAGLEGRIQRLLGRLGLPTGLDRRLFAPQGGELAPAVRAALGVDKKRSGAAVRFVVLVGGPGRAQAVPVPVAQLAGLLRPPG